MNNTEEQLFGRESMPNEWTFCSITKSGARHMAEDVGCQDIVAYRCNEEICAVVLADGAGSGAFTEIGAQAAANAAAEYLAQQFDMLLTKSEAALAQMVLTQVRKRLFQICEERNIQLCELGSTLIAAAIRGEQAILIHLGDGWIASRKNGRETPNILSWPQNGINLSYTNLTSDRSAPEKIRAVKYHVAEIQELYLLSDGWYSAEEKNDWLTEAETAVKKQRLCRAYADDVSAAALFRTTEYTAQKK